MITGGGGLYDDSIGTGYTVRRVRGAEPLSPWRRDRDLDRDLADMRERQRQRERFRSRDRAWGRKERDGRWTGNVGYYSSDSEF